jgi:hypothetical protein
MTNKKPKTLDDFPHFTVTHVRRGETSPSGYTEFELEGTFGKLDQIKGIESTWFWLLIGEHDCLCAQVRSLDKDTGAAVVTCDRQKMPDIVGEKLFYLSPYWQAFNVWMVLDPKWGWKRTQFHAVDAVAETYEAPDVSIVDGREVRKWTKVERADKKGPLNRYYPAQDQDSTDQSVREVSGGWDHEHCTLCEEHINSGDFGYCDSDGRWMCESCYDKYVKLRDLSFVYEL